MFGTRIKGEIPVTRLSVLELLTRTIVVQSVGNAGSAWLSLTIAVQVWLATKGWRLDGTVTTRPWAFLSLPGIRVGAHALYHNQMCLEHLYYM